MCLYIQVLILAQHIYQENKISAHKINIEYFAKQNPLNHVNEKLWF